MASTDFFSSCSLISILRSNELLSDCQIWSGAALCLHIKPGEKYLQRVSRETERDWPLQCC